MDLRKERAALLRAHRNRLQPADVGLPEGLGQRRTAGLRREEVAQLSGVSLTWYTWLEQGRDIPASAQVLEALARALRLDAAARRHLLALGGFATPPSPLPPQAPEAVGRILASWLPNPGYVIDDTLQILAWNATYARFWGGLADRPQEDRNALWLLLTDPTARERVQDWEGVAKALLAQFRAAAGGDAGNERFEALRRRLEAASPEYRGWWDSYAVREFQTRGIVVEDPEVGTIELELTHARLVDQPRLVLVLQTPLTPLSARRLGALHNLAEAEAPSDEEDS